MLDLFAGLGGASQTMKARGWDVVTVDTGPFDVTFNGDVRDFHARPGHFDLVWASPPCDEFSRESQPWCRTGAIPSVDLVMESIRIIREARPRWWVLENVRGSLKYIVPILGPWKAHLGPFFLWGEFPESIVWPQVTHSKQAFSGRRKDLRAKLPEGVSRALAVACEYDAGLLAWDDPSMP